MNSSNKKNHGLPESPLVTGHAPGAKPGDPTALPPGPGTASGPSRRWLRRLGWMVLAVMAVVLVLRIALWLSLPWLLNRTVEPYGLRSSYERLTLSLLTMDMEVRHLVLTAPEVQEPLADMEHCRAHVSVWSLAARRLVVYRVEVDGMEVMLLRNAQGTWRGLDGIIALMARQSKTAPAIPSRSSDTRPQPPLHLTSLQPALDLEGLSLHHLVVRFRDEAVSPPVEARLDMNLRLSDLGSFARKTRFQMLVLCEPILDQMVVEGIGSASEKTLDATFTCSGRGLRLEPLRAYLASLGIEPEARTIDFGCRSEVHMAVEEPNVPVAEANTPPTPRPKILRCQADLEDLRLITDGRVDLGLGRFSVAAVVGPGRALQIQRLEVADGQAHIRRVRDQALDVAGLSIVMDPSKRPRQAAPLPTTSQGPSSPTGTVPWQWSVEGVRLDRLGLFWQDRVAVPETEAALHLDQARIGPLRSGDGSGPVDAAIQARFSGPGLFESCDLEGRADLLSTVKTCDLDLRLQGLSFKALGPYLHKLGLESEYEAGRFAFHLTAAVGPRPSDGLLGGDLSIRNLRLEDHKEWLGLEGLTLSGFQWDPARARVHLDSVEITGQRLTLGRDPQGRFRVLGLRVKGPDQTSGPDLPIEGPIAGSPAAPAPSEPAVFPRTGRVEIGRFLWRDNEIVLEDEAVSSPPKVLRARLGMELTDLVLDLAEPNAVSGPARFQAFLQVPPLVGEIRVTGSLTGQSPSGWGADLSVVGEGIDTREASDYLRPLGLEPQIAQGDLKADIHMDLTLRPEGLGLSVGVKDLQVREAGQILAGVHRLQVRDMTLGPRLDINDIQVDRPQVTFGRDPNGALLACGIRIIPVSRVKRPTAQPASAMHLAHLSIQEGQVRWTDRSLPESLDVTAVYQVTVDDLTLGAAGPPARLKARLQAPPMAEQVDISGSLFTDPARQGANLSVEAVGLCARPLAGYLPAGLAPGLDRGQLHLGLSGLIESGPQGRQTTFQVQDLDLRETGAPDPLLHADRFLTRISQPDPNVICVEECSALGVEALVERRDPNGLALLGLRLSSGSEAGSTVTPRGGADPSPAVATPRPHLTTYPDVTVKTLDLQARRISYIDRVLTGASAVSLEDLRIRSASPWQFLGRSPQDSPPMHLEVTGHVPPLFDALEINAQVAPFAEEPNLMVDLAVQGIHGSGLTQVRPDLADLLDGSELQAGRVTGHLQAVLDIPRRHPLDLDLRRPFGLSLRLKDLQVTEGHEPAPLAGLSQLDLEIPNVDLLHRKVEVKRIEVLRPQCRLARDTQGVHVLDLLLRSAGRDSNAVRAAAEPTAQAPSGLREKDPFEVSVDQLVVSGLDVVCVDSTVDPAVEIPLTGLDLEVQGLSTRALSEPLPLRFVAVLTSGPVRLGPSLRDPNSPQSEETAALFQEVTAVGRLTGGPSPKGWIKASLGGLELRAFRGLAKANGVTLRDGVLDAGLDVRLEGHEAKTRVNVVLTDLSLTEPNEGGPLLKRLQLPVSLDTALFLLRGPDGSIRLPLQFTVTSQGVSQGQITRAAIGAAASVVAEAVAGAALRPAMALTRAIGGDTTEDKRQRTLDLIYPAGVIDVTGPQQVQLQALAKQLRRDRRLSVTIRHQLGSRDLTAAGALVNPPRSDRMALLGSLRSQRQKALALRDKLVERAYVAHVDDEFSGIRQSTDDLAGATRQVALLDRSIDALIETLRPGTEHAARRRTREAVLLIAQTRLDIVTEILGQGDLAESSTQVNVTAPGLTVAEEQTESRIVITVSRGKSR